MSYRPTELGRDVEWQPARAAKTILKAFAKAGANAEAAAKALGLSTRTFHRHVDKLGIKAQVDAIRAKAIEEGWHQTDRWPS